MSYTLKRLNVVRVVESEQEAKTLINNGFELVVDETEKIAEEKPLEEIPKDDVAEDLPVETLSGEAPPSETPSAEVPSAETLPTEKTKKTAKVK